MRNSRGLAFAIIALLAAIVVVACDRGPSIPELPPIPPAPDRGLVVVNAQANILPGGMGAVYLTIVNPGRENDRLMSITTAAASEAVAHETIEQDGVMKMVAPAEGFKVPAGGKLDFVPGGKHIMLVDPRVPEGATTFELVLHFERAGDVVVEAEVTDMSGGAMDHEGMDHGEMDHGDG